MRKLLTSQNILTLLLFALLAVLILAECNRGLAAPTPLPSANPDTTRWQNNAGDSVTTIRYNQEQIARLQLENKALRDSIAKVYKLKDKQIKQLLVLATKTTSDLQPETPDPLIEYYPVVGNCPPVPRNMQQTFSSPYYRAVVQLGDSSFHQMQSYDTLTALWSRHKQGSIFNRKTFLQLDLSLANPDTKVTGQQQYLVPDPEPKKWGVGVVAAYGFAPAVSTKPTWFVGAGVTRTFIRF